MSDIVDINVYQTVETVDIVVTPNVTEVNITSITGSLPVTKTSELENDGENGVNPFITLEDIPPFEPTDYDLEDFNNLSADPFVRVSEIPPAITIDATPTDGSANAVSSNGVFDALATKFTLPALTSGSVLFSNGSTIAQDNSQLFWDDANNRLGIGTNVPQARLDVKAQGNLATDIAFNVRNSADSADIIRANGAGDVFIGLSAGAVTTGVDNTLIGQSAGFKNTTGEGNTVLGSFAFSNNLTSSYNTAIGIISMRNITAGSNNIAIGLSSGSSQVDGGLLTSSTGSCYIGANTRSLGNGRTNQIVIGSAANGLGSNSVVLGNDSITLTALKGNVTIGATTAGARLDVRAQGALSTDIAFRVRNSADSANLFAVQGNGVTVLDSLTVTGNNIIANSATIQSYRIQLSSNPFGFSSNFQFSASGTPSTPNISTNVERTSFISTLNWSPTSGQGLYSAFNFSGVINQTGGANGITRGLFINPTLTSVADWRAIEVSNGGAYINTTSVQASAILQADSTTKGFLPPRMTNAQRLAIASPAVGLIVYCTDATEGLYENTSTGWVNLNSNKPLQVTPITLLVAGWTLVSGLYEYDYSNANITSASIVDVIPSNSTIAIVQAAGFLPSTLSTSGSVKLYANNLPTADIVVTFNIFN